MHWRMRGKDTAKTDPVETSPYLSVQLAAVQGVYYKLFPIQFHVSLELQNGFQSLPANLGVEEYILIS